MVTVTHEVSQTYNGEPLPPGFKKIACKRKNGSIYYRYHDGVTFVSTDVVARRTEYDATHRGYNENGARKQAERDAKYAELRAAYMTEHPNAVSNCAIDGFTCPPWISYEPMMQRLVAGGTVDINRYRDNATQKWIGLSDARVQAQEWTHRNDPPDVKTDDEERIYDAAGEHVSQAELDREDAQRTGGVRTLGEAIAYHMQRINNAFAAPVSYHMQSTELTALDRIPDDDDESAGIVSIELALGGRARVVVSQDHTFITDGSDELELTIPQTRAFARLISGALNTLGAL